MTELPVDELQVSARRVIRPGIAFRVKRGSGPYRKGTRHPLNLLAGEFRALRLFRYAQTPKRIYCDAVDAKSGRTHTIYVDGPHYPSHADDSVINRPYSVAVLQGGEATAPAKRNGRRRRS